MGTPLYFGAHLERMPARSAAVISAVARAEPGGVLIHCVGGRDRTGQISMLLLALVGVAATDIAADYAVSHACLTRLYAQRSENDQGPMILEYLRSQGLTVEEAAMRTLADFDAEARLRSAGVTEHEIAAIRDRLLTE